MKAEPPASSTTPLAAGERAFIGRAKEIGALDQALALASAGMGRIALIAGPPGIGKTRVLQAIAEHARAQDILVLWGRGSEEPGAPPYWPWVQAVRSFVAGHDAALVHELVGQAAAHLASMDPTLAPKLPAHKPLPKSADAAQSRFALFDAFTAFWQRAAARQPLLLLLDDLHGADVPSLKLLEFVVRECTASALFIAGSYRDAEVTRTHPLSDTLGTLARQPGALRLKLGGLSADETAQFVAAAGTHASPELAAALHERTEGHPLFLVEATRLLDHAAGTDALAALRRVPAGVRDVIGSRLNRLSPQCSHALGNAAVIGRRFSFEVLRSLLDETSEDQCLAALDEARTASLVEELPDASTLFTHQFTHALIRDALYDDMPAPRRQRLHQRIGARLEQLYGARPTALAVIAHHFHAAHSPACADQAADYAARAARHADAAAAHEEAARLYGIALQSLDAAREAECCELLLALGEAQLKASAHAAALAAFNEAFLLGRGLRQPALLGRAALGYETACWRSGGPALVSAALLKEAIAANSPLDSALRAQLLAALCRSLVFSDQIDAAVAIHHQAVAMARRLNDASALHWALSAIVPAHWRPDLRALRRAAGREAMQLAERARDPEWAMGYLTGFVVGDLIAQGEVAEVERVIDFSSSATSLRAQPFIHSILLTCRAMLAMHRGRFEEGEQLAMQGMSVATHAHLIVGASAVQMFTLRREQGRLAELAPVLERFQANVADAATWQPGYIVLCCELGRHEQAQAAFERLAAKDFGLGGPTDPTRVGGLLYLAEACAWLGDAARAARLYESLKSHAGGGIVFGEHVASFGSADRVLSMLCATMQRWDDAEAHFEQALAFDERSEGWPWLAHSQHEYATMLLDRKRPGDVQRARALLDAALATAQELGMPSLAQRVQALQQPAAAGERAVYPAGLSAREVQVLLMVAEGKTNADIAKALFRSANTVANHVRNILAKIDCANRTEAAAFAVRHGLRKRE